MTFTDWFGAHWKRPGESVNAAVIRLAGNAGISPPTARRLIDGLAVLPSTARIVADMTDGRVDAATLTKAAADEREAAAGE